jgi:hypothetical protein
MQEDSGFLPPRRGRRILVALLVLLLILLPLYLWPLRGSFGGLPSASALLGSMLDPRDPAAAARIPGDVWDALMGGTDAAPAPSPGPPPRNLTMISELEEYRAGGLDAGIRGSLLDEDPSMLAHALIGQVGTPWQTWEGAAASGDGETTSSPSPPGAGSPSGSTGDGTPWAGIPPLGGSPGYLGPWTSGGPGGPLGPGPVFPLAAPPAPTPTPEPGTLLLMGSTLGLLGAAAWKRQRRREIPTIG